MKPHGTEAASGEPAGVAFIAGVVTRGAGRGGKSRPLLVSAIERAERNVKLDKIERLAGAFGLTIPEFLQSLDAQAIGERLLAKVRRSVKS